MSTIVNTITHSITLAMSGTYASPLTTASSGGMVNSATFDAALYNFGVNPIFGNQETFIDPDNGICISATDTMTNTGTIARIPGSDLRLVAGSPIASTAHSLIPEYRGEIDMCGAGTLADTGTSGNGVLLRSGEIIGNAVGLSQSAGGGFYTGGIPGTLANTGVIGETSSNGILLGPGGGVGNAVGPIRGMSAVNNSAGPTVALAPVTKYLLSPVNFAIYANGASVSPSIWTYPTLDAAFIPSTLGPPPGQGGTYPGTEVELPMQQRFPTVSNGALQLNLQTYNLTGKGTAFQGTEITTKGSYNTDAGGIAFTAVARLDAPTTAGIVGGIFPYWLNNPTSHNEIDFELLSDHVIDGTNSVQTNIYLDQPPNSKGNPQPVPDVSLTDYQTYTMEWFPNEVLWFINGTMVNQSTIAIPGSMQFNLNIWAYDVKSTSGFQPVADPSKNTTYSFDVQSVSIAQIACFCRGTMIVTERGEVAVEELAVGDRVRTLSGALKPIVWIGMGRDLVTRANKLAQPIIVRQGALADGVPHRDLYLTHGHALHLDGVLIPVENLVNHRSILRDAWAQVVEYYHIELEDHDVLLAEGAPAESYYDAGNRAGFQNTRPGSLAGKPEPTFAPVLDSGAIVERVWDRLFERAGGRIGREITDDPDLHLVADGARLDPAAVEDGVFAFVLNAAPADALLLRSRCFVPSLLGLSRRDHWPIGVAIRRIVLQQAGIDTSFDYDQPQLREGGCYPPEDGFCCTDGEFALPPRFFLGLSGPLTLCVHTDPRFRLSYLIAQSLASAA